MAWFARTCIRMQTGLLGERVACGDPLDGTVRGVFQRGRERFKLSTILPSGSATRSYNGNISKSCIRRYRPNAPMKARTTTLRYMIVLDSNQLRQVLPGSPALKLFTVAAKRDSHTLATTDVVIPEVIRQCGVLLARCKVKAWRRRAEPFGERAPDPTSVTVRSFMRVADLFNVRSVPYVGLPKPWFGHRGDRAAIGHWCHSPELIHALASAATVALLAPSRCHRSTRRAL